MLPDLQSPPLSAHAPLLCCSHRRAPVRPRADLCRPIRQNIVNVSINFNSQSPLTETNEKAISAIQKMGRKMIYKMAREECETLRKTIAETCSLKSLNVSSQLRQKHNRPNSLYINGSAQFSITLKPEEVD